MEPGGLLSHSQVPKTGSLSWASLIQPKLSSRIFPIYVKAFHLIILCIFPHQNTVCNFLLHHTCHMSCPARSSWYGHPDYIWCNVRCSLVISYLWCHSNIIWGEKTLFVCRHWWNRYRHWAMILDTYGSGIAEMLWCVLHAIFTCIYCNWVLISLAAFLTLVTNIYNINININIYKRNGTKTQ